MNLKDEFRWLWKYGLPAAPIFAVIVYGVLRQLYATFYGTLGASPEEVGLGYQEVLALSGAAMFAFALPIGAFALVRLKFKTGPQRRVSIVAAVLVAPVLIAAGISWLYQQTKADAARAYQGGEVTSVNFGGIQVLGLRAEPALVQWSGTPPQGEDISGHCLMYLGTANGFDVFFDPGPGAIRTIRLQASAIVLTVYRAVPGPSGGDAHPTCSGGQVEAGGRFGSG
jgi:hypothetical protein